MYRHLPRGQKRRVLPKRDDSHTPYIRAGRVMRQMPNLTYSQFCAQLRIFMGETPNHWVRWDMYVEYMRHHEVEKPFRNGK